MAQALGRSYEYLSPANPVNGTILLVHHRERAPLSKSGSQPSSPNSLFHGLDRCSKVSDFPIAVWLPSIRSSPLSQCTLCSVYPRIPRGFSCKDDTSSTQGVSRINAHQVSTRPSLHAVKRVNREGAYRQPTMTLLILRQPGLV